jgi:hypothetical protein
MVPYICPVQSSHGCIVLTLGASFKFWGGVHFGVLSAPWRFTLQGEKELLAKYTNSRLESYMEDNNRVTYCPSTPWCGHAIEVSWVF